MLPYIMYGTTKPRKDRVLRLKNVKVMIMIMNKSLTTSIVVSIILTRKQAITNHM